MHSLNQVLLPHSAQIGEPHGDYTVAAKNGTCTVAASQHSGANGWSPVDTTFLI
jgi:hypothetical protein